MVSGRRVTLAGVHQRLGGHDRRPRRPGWDIAGDDDAGRPTLLERGREAADRRGELPAGGVGGGGRAPPRPQRQPAVHLAAAGPPGRARGGTAGGGGPGAGRVRPDRRVRLRAGRGARDAGDRRAATRGGCRGGPAAGPASGPVATAGRDRDRPARGRPRPGRRVRQRAGAGPGAQGAEGARVIQVAPGTKVHLACRPVSMRYGFDGLAAQVANTLKADPYSGHLFLFRGKRGDYLKVLYWDGSGLVVLSLRHLCKAGWAERPEGLRDAEPLPHRRRRLRAGVAAASVVVDGVLQPDEPEAVVARGGLARLEPARVQPAVDRSLRHIEPDRQLRHRAFIRRAVHDRARAVTPVRQQALALEQRAGRVLAERPVAHRAPALGVEPARDLGRAAAFADHGLDPGDELSVVRELVRPPHRADPLVG